MLDNCEELPLPSELPPIPDGWHYELLVNLVEKRGVSYGIVQPGSETSDGVPIVRVNNIRNGRIDTSEMLKVDTKIEAKFQRSRLCGGEVLLTLVGTLGEVAIVPDTLRGWNVARAVGVIPVRKDPGNQWVSICLRSAFVQHCIRTWATTTVQATFNLRDLAKIPIPIPPEKHRKAIAHILKTIDDKIELNRRMNETLEGIARALFQSWFVDFDPVRAKLDGRQPAGMDAETAALFPGSFQNSELGHIPKGWCVKTTDEIAAVGIGKTPPRKEHHWFSENPSDLPWMSIRDLGEAGVFISKTSEFLTSAAVEKFHVRRIPDDTVVLSFKLTIGRVAITDGEMLSNEAIAHFKLNPDTPFGSAYLYCYLKGFGYDQLGSTSSIASAINSDMVRKINVLVPPKELGCTFQNAVMPLFTQMKNLQRESQTLASLRDTLLPKLLSGELRVEAAERELEGVR